MSRASSDDPGEVSRAVAGPVVGDDPVDVGDAVRCEPDLGSGQERSSGGDRKSTRLNSSHVAISYAVFCLKKRRYQEQRGYVVHKNKLIVSKKDREKLKKSF